ncbi:hypothetical protein [Thermoflexus sp.]|uniref:hypothetical protein n=1 Tax=Thermoflexus sp. TaxID=1969742 RepID=UPI002ADD3BB8|nr:hypothetical protein [Thermoflexus sp.]
MLFALLDRLALILAEREIRLALRPPLPPFIGELLLLLPDGPFVFALARADDGQLLALRLDFRHREAEVL